MKYEPTITTCSHAASKMGSRQKVIAFTYFKGRKDEEISRKYEAGIFGNLEAIGQYYSKESLSSSSSGEASEEEAEWSMRVYHNLEDDDLDLCHLACLNRNRAGRFRGRPTIQLPPLVLCNVNRNPLFGNASVILPTLWRFLPMLDDQVGKKTRAIRICRIEFIKRAMPSFFISWLARFREIWQRVYFAILHHHHQCFLFQQISRLKDDVFSFTFSDALLQIRKTIADASSSSFQTLTMHNFV